MHEEAEGGGVKGPEPKAEGPTGQGAEGGGAKGAMAGLEFRAREREREIAEGSERDLGS